MRLLPKQEKFFHLFSEQAELILQASKLLLDGTRAGNSELAKCAEEIQRLEAKGDEIIHEVFHKLNQTFITPIDPEDIHRLSSALDDVLDALEESLHRIAAYRLDPIPETVVRLCELVHGCAAALEKALVALEKDQPLLDHCIEVNRLEDAADKLVRATVANLFETEKDPIQLLKKKEVCEYLETTTDRCEDVADILQNVVVKNN